MVVTIIIIKIITIIITIIVTIIIMIIIIVYIYDYFIILQLVFSISQTNPHISATSALVSVAPTLAVHLGGTSEFRTASALKGAWRPGFLEPDRRCASDFHASGIPHRVLIKVCILMYSKHM